MQITFADAEFASKKKQTRRDRLLADLESLVPDNPMSVDRLQWEHIQRVLTEHDGNISATARALGMHRRTLQRKLQKRPVRR